MTSWTTHTMPNYDSWLEAPYQRNQGDVPRDVEDWLDVTIWLQDEDSEATVTSYEPWEDADEDGRYGGIDLIVTVEDTGREINMRPDAVQEAFEAQKARQEA